MLAVETEGTIGETGVYNLVPGIADGGECRFGGEVMQVADGVAVPQKRIPKHGRDMNIKRDVIDDVGG